jgi:hypothetical protein
VQPATSELPGCPSAWTTGPMDRGTTGTDDGTGGFRGGFICHPDVGRLGEEGRRRICCKYIYADHACHTSDFVIEEDSHTNGEE